MKQVYHPGTPEERLLDDLIARAQSDADEWISRLDTMRGHHTVQEALRRTEAIGFERLLEQLDAIAYPPEGVVAFHLDASHRWADSEAEMRINRQYKKHQRGRGIVCVRTLESLQRAKATTEFWELAGVHPRDAENDPDGFSLEWAWGFFTKWKAYGALARRSAGHQESRGFATMAKAYRILTAHFLVCAPRKDDLTRAAELAAKCLLRS